MAFNGFVNIFTNSPIQPTDVSFLTLPLPDGTASFTLEWVFQNPGALYPFCQFIQLTGTDDTGTYTITLPNALYASNVQSCIIYNQAASNVTINNAAATQVGLAEPSIAYFVGNIDNTTEGGNWVFLTLGAGTSSVTAADLIDPTFNGYTPPESNSGGLGAFGQYLKVNQKIYDYAGTDYPGNSSDRGTVVTWNGGSGNYTLPLTSASGDGFISGLQNRSTSGGVINVYTSGDDTLNGVADSDTDLPAQVQLQPGESTYFVTDGDGSWYTFCFSSNISYVIQDISYELSTSGGAITVSAQDSSYQIQKFTGTYGTSTDVEVTFPQNIVQQYFISNQSTVNTLLVSINNDTDPLYQYTVLPGMNITTFTDGVHLYLSPNVVADLDILLPDGSAGSPSLSFVEDPTTGLYRNPTGSLLSFAQGGVAVASFASTNATFFQPLRVATNAVTYSFTGQTTSGIGYTTATSSVDVTVAGTLSTSTSALGLNIPTGTCQQAGINIYSIMRAYQNG